MSTAHSVAVTQEELDDLFRALDLWDKIANGHLTADVIPRARAPSKRFPGGVSDIVRHANPLGYHVATSHRITLADGSVPHWDAKDLRMGDVLLIRAVTDPTRRP